MHLGAIAGVWLAVVLALLPVACASAEFSPAQLLSGTSTRQFDSASSPAFSKDRRYVVFRGSLAGVHGIYRRDLSTGEIAVVAREAPAGASEAEERISAPDASAPSISAEGRYVAFTSSAVLDPQAEGPQAGNGEGCPQVYVRDMSLASTSAKAYVLASAVNGGSEGLTYENRCSNVRSPSAELAIGGAQAAAGVALSGDGRKVVFTVLSRSDLSGPCTGSPLQCPTEASQVAVRDLDAQTTTLVSATPAGEPTPGGGAFPSGASEQRLSGDLMIESDEPIASSASISSDASTVAWQGTDVPIQIPSAVDVDSGMARFGGAGLEVEPLWRHIADGRNAVTRRLLGDAGLNFYFGESHEGTFAVEGGALAPVDQAFVPPVLSADGKTVAVISNAPTPVNQPTYRFLDTQQPPPAEAYVVYVENDVTASPQVTTLTATPDFSVLNAIHDGVGEITLSPDASRVAFNTRRVSFASASSTLISPPVPEALYASTYVANLRLGTLQRVTSTYEGGLQNGEPGQLSFSGEGLSLAFSSSASNLFYGDVTPGRSQVYAVEETPPSTSVSPTSESLPILQALPTPTWTMSALATPQSDGSVVLDTFLPSAGKLIVRASAQLPLGSNRKTAHAKGKREKKKRASRASKVVLVATRTVGQVGAVVKGPSEVRVRLRVGAAYRALVAARYGLYCVLELSFSAPGHAKLEQQIPVTLHRVVHRKPAKSKTSSHTPRRKQGTRT